MQGGVNMVWVLEALRVDGQEYSMIWCSEVFHSMRCRGYFMVRGLGVLQSIRQASSRQSNCLRLDDRPTYATRMEV